MNHPTGSSKTLLGSLKEVIGSKLRGVLNWALGKFTELTGTRAAVDNLVQPQSQQPDASSASNIGPLLSSDELRMLELGVKDGKYVNRPVQEPATDGQAGLIRSLAGSTRNGEEEIVDLLKLRQQRILEEEAHWEELQDNRATWGKAKPRKESPNPNRMKKYFDELEEERRQAEANPKRYTLGRFDEYLTESLFPTDKNENPSDYNIESPKPPGKDDTKTPKKRGRNRPPDDIDGLNY